MTPILNALQSERYAILHADDFGMCHSTNQAILHMLETGAITSTTLMVNCPWSLEAACAVVVNPALDVGVHLTLTSEWDVYKWGPILRGESVDSLIDEHGHFPPATGYMANVDYEQIRKELTAQIELAIRMGVDPTHLDNHMGSLRAHHYEMFVELAAQFDLPIRFPGRRANLTDKELAVAKLAKDLGVAHPDFIYYIPFSYEESVDYSVMKQLTIDNLRALKPGVTEVVFHPSLDTGELKAITDTWQLRRYEYDLFLDPDVQETILQEGIRLIGWRELREMQRQQRASRSVG